MKTPAAAALPDELAISLPDKGAQTSPESTGRVVNSEALLQGGRTVQISHNGSIYRLQATRLGKLILTK